MDEDPVDVDVVLISHNEIDHSPSQVEKVEEGRGVSQFFWLYDHSYFEAYLNFDFFKTPTPWFYDIQASNQRMDLKVGQDVVFGSSKFEGELGVGRLIKIRKSQACPFLIWVYGGHGVHIQRGRFMLCSGVKIAPATRVSDRYALDLSDTDHAIISYTLDQQRDLKQPNWEEMNFKDLCWRVLCCPACEAAYLKIQSIPSRFRDHIFVQSSTPTTTIVLHLGEIKKSPLHFQADSLCRHLLLNFRTLGQVCWQSRINEETGENEMEPRLSLPGARLQLLKRRIVLPSEECLPLCQLNFPSSSSFPFFFSTGLEVAINDSVERFLLDLSTCLSRLADPQTRGRGSSRDLAALQVRTLCRISEHLSLSLEDRIELVNKFVLGSSKCSLNQTPLSFHLELSQSESQNSTLSTCSSSPPSLTRRHVKLKASN